MLNLIVATLTESGWSPVATTCGIVSAKAAAREVSRNTSRLVVVFDSLTDEDPNHCVLLVYRNGHLDRSGDALLDAIHGRFIARVPRVLARRRDCEHDRCASHVSCTFVRS